MDTYSKLLCYYINYNAHEARKTEPSRVKIRRRIRTKRPVSNDTPPCSFSLRTKTKLRVNANWRCLGAIKSQQCDGNVIQGRIPTSRGSLTYDRWCFLRRRSIPAWMPGSLTRLDSLCSYHREGRLVQ